MKTIAVRNNAFGIVHQSLQRTSRDILAVKYKLNVVLARLVGNKRHIVFAGGNRSHVNRDISVGAPALNCKLPKACA